MLVGRPPEADLTATAAVPAAVPVGTAFGPPGTAAGPAGSVSLPVYVPARMTA